MYMDWDTPTIRRRATGGVSGSHKYLLMDRPTRYRSHFPDKCAIGPEPEFLISFHFISIISFHFISNIYNIDRDHFLTHSVHRSSAPIANNARADAHHIPLLKRKQMHGGQVNSWAHSTEINRINSNAGQSEGFEKWFL